MGIRKKQLHFVFKKINRETDSSDQQHNFLLIYCWSTPPTSTRALRIEKQINMYIVLSYCTVGKKQKNRKRTAQSYKILSKHL